MANVNNQGGQRGNLSAGGSGKKERSETSHGQKGSRVEPSHTKDQVKNDGAKKEPSAAPKDGKKNDASAQPANSKVKQT